MNYFSPFPLFRSLFLPHARWEERPPSENTNQTKLPALRGRRRSVRVGGARRERGFTPAQGVGKRKNPPAFLQWNTITALNEKYCEYPSRYEPWYETKLLFLFPFSPQNSMMVKCVFKGAFRKPNETKYWYTNSARTWDAMKRESSPLNNYSTKTSRNTSENGLNRHPGQCFDLCCIFSHVIWM